jgi:hypothetical protein
MKELRRELSRIERDLAAAEGRVAELTRRLGEPGLYDDADSAAKVIAEHGVAKDEAMELSARWVDVGTQLEQLESGAEGSAG